MRMRTDAEIDLDSAIIWADDSTGDLSQTEYAAVTAYASLSSARSLVKVVQLLESLAAQPRTPVQPHVPSVPDPIDRARLDGDDDESLLVVHARRELALVKADDVLLVESLVHTVEEFASYGHSGGSHTWAVRVLYDLLRFLPLSPLTDDPGEWHRVLNRDPFDPDNPPLWQSVRKSSCFSHDGGRTYWDTDDPTTEEFGRLMHDSVPFCGGVTSGDTVR